MARRYAEAIAAAQELVKQAGLSDEALAEAYHLHTPGSPESQTRMRRFRANAKLG